MRVYALFHKSVYLFGMTLVLGLMNPIISTVSSILSALSASIRCFNMVNTCSRHLVCIHSIHAIPTRNYAELLSLLHRDCERRQYVSIAIQYQNYLE